MKFELVQPGECLEYFYNILGDDNVKHGELRYYGESGWLVEYAAFTKWVRDNEWVLIGNKINELNALTKADKLFGFL